MRCTSAIATAKVGWKSRLRLVPLALLGASLARISKRRHWDHLHVHSCADAAHIAMFARILGGVPYSLTLHGPLSDYGPNQRQKWRNAEFVVVICGDIMTMPGLPRVPSANHIHLNDEGLIEGLF